jgi:hypothetical protein
MPSPQINFPDEKAELRYGLKVLVEAGLTPEQIDKMREKVGNGPGKIPYNKETTGLRRFMVQELLAANLSNSQIARVMKLSKETVSGDRHQNRNLWTESIIKSHDCQKARLLQESMALKEEAMKNFETSKKKTITTISDRGETISITESAGESSFLTVAKGCIEQQAKLLGLYDFEKQKVKEEKDTYKHFLDNLASQITKVKDAEKNAGDRLAAIDTESEPVEPEFDEDGNPSGSSRAILCITEDDDDAQGDSGTE